ncbi:MAG TPA: MarR family winged helix-turn-helix transcriptional regulator [Candidatus Saccharimonadales bacterium]
MGSISTIGYLMQHTASIMYRQSDQVLQERLGIGMSQYKILVILQDRPHIQQRTLAELLGQTEASVSRQIKLLCNKAMLAVEINPKNRREHLMVPTARGYRITQAAMDTLQEYHASTFDQFNDKEKQLLEAMLNKMHAAACNSRKSIPPG